jgi:hypothetical protein
MDSTTSCVEKCFGAIFSNPQHIKKFRGNFDNPTPIKNVLKPSWEFKNKGKHMEEKLIAGELEKMCI